MLSYSKHGFRSLYMYNTRYGSSGDRSKVEK
jgi:hypothetical protein